MTVCERCGTESPTGFRFCGGCGAPLPESATPSDTRKIVTALFCDAVDSTALGEDLDPEALRNVISRYFEEISGTIERHGGTVQKFAGDAVMAIFGVPRVHEDDALRAVRAAAEIHQRLPLVARELGVTVRFRTGLNTGLVLTDEGKTLAYGDAVNVAARLEQAAAPDEILLGADTLGLVRDAVKVQALEPLTLKGKSEPVPAFRLLAIDPVAPGFSRRLDVPLVGRERELGLLRDAWERTVAQSDCHLFTLLGTAGVGKSRLVDELLAQVGGAARTLRGRCLPYGEGITFWPIIEALIDVGRSAGPVREHLSSGGVATPEELFWEVRQLLESLSAAQPVILYVDDLQWAEPMLLDLLDHIAELSRGAPILLLCTARPELLEDRAGWGGGKLSATTLLLEPLGSRECELLLAELGDVLESDARAAVIRASDGNPLFLQEMVAFARERGVVVVPPTIQALLAARLERLSAQEREPLERGAVEGQVFHRSAVRALLGERLAAELETRLEALVRKDLIRAHPPTIAGDDAFRFRHLLIRDAAYERLPKGTRADLHERFARWLEEAPATLAELEEIAGWHLEQAVRYQRELGRKVEPALALRAAGHLHAAGRRASERSDASAARNLLERALAVVPEQDQLHAAIGAALAERLIEVGELARADELLAGAEREQGDDGPVSLNRLEWLVLAQPESAAETVSSTLPAMLEQLARAGDERGIAKAHMLAFWVHWAANRATLAAEQVRLAAEHARSAQDNGLRSVALGWYVATLIYGPQPAAAISRELEAIERDHPGPYLTAHVAIGRGEVARLEERFDDARRLTQHALEGFLALGMTPMAASCRQSLARIEFSAGDAAAARASLLRCDQVLAALGERPLRSTTQAMLARAHQLVGADEAARAALMLVQDLSAPQDVINYAISDGVRARLALAEGAGEVAEQWARSAVDHAFLSDFIDLQAEAKLGLAHVLSELGRSEQAGAEARAALELFGAKGDQPGSRAARALLDQ